MDVRSSADATNNTPALHAFSPQLPSLLVLLSARLLQRLVAKNTNELKKAHILRLSGSSLKAVNIGVFRVLNTTENKVQKVPIITYNVLYGTTTQSETETPNYAFSRSQCITGLACLRSEVSST